MHHRIIHRITQSHTSPTPALISRFPAHWISKLPAVAISDNTFRQVYSLLPYTHIADIHVRMYVLYFVISIYAPP